MRARRSLDARLRRLEERGAQDLHYVSVFRESGETDEEALERTLAEMGLMREQIGYAALWLEDDEGELTRVLIDRCGGNPSKLIGFVTHEQALEQLELEDNANNEKSAQSRTEIHGHDLARRPRAIAARRSP